jgi:uncharacterized protein (TIGR02466 family)
MAIKKCFPTLLYYEKLASPSQTKSLQRDLLKEVPQWQETDFNGQEWSESNYTGGYTSYSSISDLHKRSSTFQKLSDHLRKHALVFLKALEYEIPSKELQMTSCWINVVPPGHSHSLHLHPLSLISGTYYLKVPKKCGSLKFEDPRLSKFMAAPPRKAQASMHNQAYLHFQPKENYVVLFESWLRHEVEKNLSHQDRISISFNFNWF